MDSSALPTDRSSFVLGTFSIRTKHHLRQSPMNIVLLLQQPSLVSGTFLAGPVRFVVLSDDVLSFTDRALSRAGSFLSGLCLSGLSKKCFEVRHRRGRASMKITWVIIGFVVAVLIFLGWKNLLAFNPNLFLVLLFLLSFLITVPLWFFRKRLR
jgi:hypothetical protein